MGKVNWVTLLLGAIAALFIYGGYKYVPVYMQTLEVDQALSRAKYDALKLTDARLYSRSDALIQRAYAEIVATGVDETTLRVYFASDWTSVHADYEVVLEHPLVGPVTHRFAREQEIDRSGHDEL